MLKTDAVVGGIHFFPDDPPDTIARKALRVCRGLGVPFVLAIALWSLVAASTITVVQRFATVYRQSRARQATRA